MKNLISTGIVIDPTPRPAVLPAYASMTDMAL
jgi:hypothetical protein